MDAAIPATPGPAPASPPPADATPARLAALLASPPSYAWPAVGPDLQLAIAAERQQAESRAALRCCVAEAQRLAEAEAAAGEDPAAALARLREQQRAVEAAAAAVATWGKVLEDLLARLRGHFRPPPEATALLAYEMVRCRPPMTPANQAFEEEGSVEDEGSPTKTEAAVVPVANRHRYQQVARHVVLIQRVWRRWRAARHAPLEAQVRHRTRRRLQAACLCAWRQAAVAVRHRRRRTLRLSLSALQTHARIGRLRRQRAAGRLQRARALGTRAVCFVVWRRYSQLMQRPVEEQLDMQWAGLTDCPHWDEWFAARATTLRLKLARRPPPPSDPAVLLEAFEAWQRFVRRRRSQREKLASAAAYWQKRTMRKHYRAWRRFMRLRPRRDPDCLSFYFGRWRLFCLRKVKERRATRKVAQLRTLRLLYRWQGQAYRRQILEAATTLRIMHRRPICLTAMFALRGDEGHIALVKCWQKWKGYVTRRVFTGMYFQSLAKDRDAQLRKACFDAWKVFLVAEKVPGPDNGKLRLSYVGTGLRLKSPTVIVDHFHKFRRAFVEQLQRRPLRAVHLAEPGPTFASRPEGVGAAPPPPRPPPATHALPAAMGYRAVAHAATLLLLNHSSTAFDRDLRALTHPFFLPKVGPKPIPKLLGTLGAYGALQPEVAEPQLLFEELNELRTRRLHEAKQTLLLLPEPFAIKGRIDLPLVMQYCDHECRRLFVRTTRMMARDTFLLMRFQAYVSAAWLELLNPKFTRDGKGLKQLSEEAPKAVTLERHAVVQDVRGVLLDRGTLPDHIWDTARLPHRGRLRRLVWAHLPALLGPTFAGRVRQRHQQWKDVAKALMGADLEKALHGPKEIVYSEDISKLLLHLDRRSAVQRMHQLARRPLLTAPERAAERRARKVPGVLFVLGWGAGMARLSQDSAAPNGPEERMFAGGLQRLALQKAGSPWLGAEDALNCTGELSAGSSDMHDSDSQNPPGLDFDPEKPLNQWAFPGLDSSGLLGSDFSFSRTATDGLPSPAHSSWSPTGYQFPSDPLSPTALSGRKTPMPLPTLVSRGRPALPTDAARPGPAAAAAAPSPATGRSQARVGRPAAGSRLAVPPATRGGPRTRPPRTSAAAAAAGPGTPGGRRPPPRGTSAAGQRTSAMPRSAGTAGGSRPGSAQGSAGGTLPLVAPRQQSLHVHTLQAPGDHDLDPYDASPTPNAGRARKGAGGSPRPPAGSPRPRGPRPASAASTASSSGVSRRPTSASAAAEAEGEGSMQSARAAGAARRGRRRRKERRGEDNDSEEDEGWEEDGSDGDEAESASASDAASEWEYDVATGLWARRPSRASGTRRSRGRTASAASGRSEGTPRTGASDRRSDASFGEAPGLEAYHLGFGESHWGADGLADSRPGSAASRGKPGQLLDPARTHLQVAGATRLLPSISHAERRKSQRRQTASQVFGANGELVLDVTAADAEDPTAAQRAGSVASTAEALSRTLSRRFQEWTGPDAPPVQLQWAEWLQSLYHIPALEAELRQFLQRPLLYRTGSPVLAEARPEWGTDDEDGEGDAQRRVSRVSRASTSSAFRDGSWQPAESVGASGDLSWLHAERPALQPAALGSSALDEALLAKKRALYDKLMERVNREVSQALEEMKNHPKEVKEGLGPSGGLATLNAQFSQAVARQHAAELLELERELYALVFESYSASEIDTLDEKLREQDGSPLLRLDLSAVLGLAEGIYGVHPKDKAKRMAHFLAVLAPAQPPEPHATTIRFARWHRKTSEDGALTAAPDGPASAAPPTPTPRDLSATTASATTGSTGSPRPSPRPTRGPAPMGRSLPMPHLPGVQVTPSSPGPAEGPGEDADQRRSPWQLAWPMQAADGEAAALAGGEGWARWLLGLRRTLRSPHGAQRAAALRHATRQLQFLARQLDLLKDLDSRAVSSAERREVAHLRMGFQCRVMEVLELVSETALGPDTNFPPEKRIREPPRDVPRANLLVSSLPSADGVKARAAAVPEHSSPLKLRPATAVELPRSPLACPVAPDRPGSALPALGRPKC